MESPSVWYSSMASRISSAVSGSAHRTSLSSVCSSISSKVTSGASMSPIWLTWAFTCTSCSLCSNTCLAMAPAATQFTVSRAEERPPPPQLRVPNFAE